MPGTAMFGGTAAADPGLGSVWAQGSAIAEGTSTIEVTKPTAATTDTATSRETADMSHLPETRNMLM